MASSGESVPPAFRMDGRVAVVTGGGSGMGRAIAHTLAAAGAAVTIGDINDAAGAATRDSIVAEGGRAQSLYADVCRKSDLEALTQAAVDTFGGLHFMCNLGGAPTPSVEMLDVTDEQFDRAFDGHLRSVLYGCQAAVPHILRSGGGAIVNMSSTAIDAPVPSTGLYHLAKSGSAALTRVLANELGPRGVRVNAIAPGVTLTNFSTRHFSDSNGVVDEQRRAQWIETMSGFSPMHMVGDAQDQAWLVLYLLSDAARFVTGQVVRANGGWTMGS
jgi:3-oxoacyl-[acyl-carrier protein] reductase